MLKQENLSIAEVINWSIKYLHLSPSIARRLLDRISSTSLFLKDKHLILSPIYSEKDILKNNIYIPIEFFKEVRLIKKVASNPSGLIKYFLSSGTSSPKRSHSFFSENGLLAYKVSSLYSFYNVIKSVMRVTDPFLVEGISLIPQKVIWNSSSLACMLDWISGYSNVTYLDIESGDYRKRLKEVNLDRPVWLFATAFHYVNTHDLGLRIPLPPGSIVFETGGTKGKSRSVSRKELFDIIEKVFDVSCSHVISEYGMSELASQAYSTGSKEGEEPILKFPDWVNTFVMTGMGGASASGLGSLLVRDPFRVDYPYYFRTQDVVELDSQGKFLFIGRAITAPIKGCSILADNEKKELICFSEATKNIRNERSKDKLFDKGIQTLLILDTVKKFLQSKFAEDLLAVELGYRAVAKSALLDLVSSMPKDVDSCHESVKKSQALSGDNWLFVLPNNHSVVGIYPIFVACCAGINLRVRLPTKFSEGSLCSELINILSSLSFVAIKQVSPNFRLDTSKYCNIADNILFYGKDETLDSLKLSNNRIKGFGSSLSIAVIDVWSDEAAAAIVKDAFNLSQRGCVSIKAVVSFCDYCEREYIYNLLINKTKNFISERLNIFDAVSVDYEILRLGKYNKFYLYQKNLEYPVFLFRDVSGILNKKKLLESITQTAFVLPVLFCKKEQKDKFLSECKSIVDKFLVEECSLGFAKSAKLGTANNIIWDGFYEGRPLFSK
jgi:hypothetical protein